MVKVSLAGVSTGFEPLPAGQYKVVFTKYTELGTDTDKPKYRAQLTVKNAPNPDLIGKVVFDRGTLQGHALFGFKRMIAAFDPKHPALESTKQFDTEAVAKDVIGKDCDVVLTESTYEGRKGNNVNYVLESEKGDGWSSS